MNPIPAATSVVVAEFDPARVFPPDDSLTVPLLRLMLATDDVRHAQILFVMTNQQVAQTTGTQQILHVGQQWYLFRLLCSHLKEGGDALKTLVSSVAGSRLKDLLRDRPEAIDALRRLGSAYGRDTYISKVRHSIGFHYDQADIKRVFERDLADGRVEGMVVACEVGGLSRFVVTDVLALRLLDNAAGDDLGAGGAEFVKRGQEVTALAGALSNFVGNLVDALLTQHGAEGTEDTIEVPALLRAGLDAWKKAHERGEA